MLTATCEPNVSEVPNSAQNETLPSDAEISRRVLMIRSHWTNNERERRREMAEQRFADLIAALINVEEAA